MGMMIPMSPIPRPDGTFTINDYLDQHNADPKPFAWTASASSIIDKVNRGKQALESLH